MAGRFSVEAVFRAIDKISAPVSKMSNRIGKFSRRAQRSFRSLNTQVDRLGGGLRRVGMAGGAAMAGLGFAAANVIKTGADFEQQLTNAAAKFGNVAKGSAAFAKIEAAAAKAGRTTEFTASASAMALNSLAMAGYNAEQSIAALPAVVNTATAAQIELEEASSIVVSTMGAFGKASKDNATFTKNLAEVTDLMAATATSAATNFEEMQEVIKLSGPVSTAAGADMKTFMAITGQLANAGIRGSVAGTTLKNMFLKLAAPVPKAAKELKKLGIVTKDNHGNLLDVVDILKQVEEKTKKMGTAQKSAALSTIFGLRAIAGVNVLLKNGIGTLESYRNQLDNATGASDRMAKQMRDTLLGRLKGLESAFESVKIAIFGLRSKALAGLIEKITEFTRKVSVAITENKNLGGALLDDVLKGMLAVIQVFGILIGLYVAGKVAVLAFNTAMIAGKGILIGYKVALIALKVVVGLFKVIVAIATVAQHAFNLAMWLNPIGLIIALIVALIGIIAVAIIYWDDIKKAVGKAWDWIVEKTKIAVAYLKGAFDTVAKPFKSLLGSLGRLFGKAQKVQADIEFKKGPESDIFQQTVFGSGEYETQAITPGERMATQITESSHFSNFELLIKDQEQTKHDVELTGPKQSIQRKASGEFALTG